MSDDSPKSRRRPKAKSRPAETYQDVTLRVARPRSFDVAGGGRLVVEPGELALAFRLRRDPDLTGDMPMDTASCLVRIADAEGAVWESESTFGLHVFLEAMTDFNRHTWLIRFDDAEAGWKAAFDAAPMMTGAITLIDDRFYRRFLVGGETIVELVFKYQCPTYDVAFHRDPDYSSLSILLVRVSGLIDSDANEIRPLVFEMDWSRLLFRNEIFINADGNRDSDDLPPAIVFRRTDHAAAPPAIVRHEPG